MEERLKQLMEELRRDVDTYDEQRKELQKSVGDTHLDIDIVNMNILLGVVSALNIVINKLDKILKE
jgi:hypothetical protein